MCNNTLQFSPSSFVGLFNNCIYPIIHQAVDLRRFVSLLIAPLIDFVRVLLFFFLTLVRILGFKRTVNRIVSHHDELFLTGDFFSFLFQFILFYMCDSMSMGENRTFYSFQKHNLDSLFECSFAPVERFVERSKHLKH